MVPLTYELNRLNCGYQMKNENVKVSNLLYMDDLKIFGQNERELTKEVKVILTYSTDIGIEVGDSDLIIELGENETYEYLGINETRGIDETEVKDRSRREYIKRVNKVLKGELNSRNKMLAIGEITVPVLQYSFGVVNWIIKELENIDRQTKKMLTTYKMHHPKANVDRLYTSRKDGDRELIQRAVQEHLTDKEQIYEWLRKGELKGETESLIIAAQDQASNTRYHKKNMLRQNVNSKYRLCEKHEETTERTIARSVPGDRRVKEKEAEKVLKYKQLALETQRMWNCRTKVIP
ncbi:hypothetical protein ILUMI_16608, partial [Ignelater luminosus]